MKKKLFFVLLLLGIFVSFFAGKTYAQDAFPGPTKCDPSDVKDPEYSSGRPYQASMCGDRPITYACGNTVVAILNNVKCPYNGSGTCTPRQTHFEQKIVIDLTNVELPILGNTDDTENSQAIGIMDEGQKVNNYLAWYLGGTDTKAEGEKATDDELINFSGPVRKLLPGIIQDAQRNKIIKTATTTISVTDEETQVTTDESENHNHIVVCAKQGDGGLAGWFKDLFGIGKSNPVPCYDGDGSPANNDVYRLTSWDGNLSIANTAGNALVSAAINFFQTIYPFIPGGALQESLGDHYNFRKPPLPWDDGTGKPFEKEVLYQKAYYEWRGQTCVIIPGIDKLACFENFLVPNKYADLFPYVPLGSTSDKKGSELVTGTGFRAPRATLGNTSYQIIKNPALWLPHTAYNNELLELLKTTYKSGSSEPASMSLEEALALGIPPSVFQAANVRSEIPDDVENNSLCKIINTRSNPGDLVTFENPESYYEIDVQYDVTEVQCSEPKEVCRTIRGDNPNTPQIETSYEECSLEADCSSDIYALIPAVGKTPYADEIWNNTIAAEDSIFRRIFPKSGAEAPISCIADIPAESRATYTVSDRADNKIKLWKVEAPDGTSIDAEGGSADSIEAKLFYPHFGSVLDYFLKGIQTALRPKGYGDALAANACTAPVEECGDWESKLPASAGGACGICGEPNAPIGDLAKKILTAAGEEYQVPAANIWAAMLHEGGDWTEFNGFKDEDVRKWSNHVSCGGEPMPRCDNTNPVTQPPFGFLEHWFYLGDGDNALWSAVQAIDPARNSKERVTRCNFLDAAFAAAKLLKQSASNTVAGTSCGTYSGFDTTYPGTCSAWNDLKVAQSQNGYAGLCVNDLPGHLYTIEQAVGWYNSAKCN